MVDWTKFSKTIFESKISCISTSFRKEIGILSSKKVTGPAISQNCLSDKAPGSQNIFSPKSFLLIVKTVLVVDLIFKF